MEIVGARGLAGQRVLWLWVLAFARTTAEYVFGSSNHVHVIASEATQSRVKRKVWIASSLTLLAMTVETARPN